MTAEQKFSESIAAWRAIESSPPERIADVACVIWAEISIALSPVIGQGGVTALLKRSIHLVRLEYPAVDAMHGAVILPGKLMVLHAALTQLTAAEAFATNSEILDTFHMLLVKLIGTALTHHLLHSIVDTPSGDIPG